jgi:small subunit ribosomal protein S1
MAEDQQKPEAVAEDETAPETDATSAADPENVAEDPSEPTSPETESAVEAASPEETAETASGEPEAEPTAEPEAAAQEETPAEPEAVAGETPPAEPEPVAEEETPTEPEAVAGEETPAEPGAAAEEETPAEPEPVAEEASVPVTPATIGPVIGYKGEIVGDTVRLEDLQEQAVGLGRAETDYDALRAMVETTLTVVSEQEIVKGKVVSIGEKDVVIDIGFKSDGIVSKNEFDHELMPGEEVEVFLERMEDWHGQLVLSKTKADTVRRWRRIEEAFQGETVLEGTIVRRIKGGMIVELFEGLEAFLPGSQIDVRPVRDFDTYLDKRMEFKIVKLNPANENIVVSHKALIEKDLQKQRESILSTMEPGQILEGTVKNITDFGVFIDLGGVDGLLHITDLSWGRVAHPSELVSLDDKLNIVVLDYDKERQRISLGLKQLQPHPWDNIAERLNPGDTVEGKVVSITDYGAFVEIEKGIEGLVHISEMSWTEHVRHPSQMVALGQMVKVKILNVDHEGKKISLGMKQLEPDPWENIADRYPPGTVMRGKVRNITNFGVFVEIEPGIDGLVHISDLSWTKKVRHPSEMIRKGQELDVVVLNIDSQDRRISLGHKQVDTNPWNQFGQVYSEGSGTEGKVVRVEDKGVVVELPMEVEAFIPQGELRNATHFGTAYREGDELKGLIVTRFDAAEKEILLSEIAAERAEAYQARQAERRERETERQQERRDIERFSKVAGGASGPTTLGELSDLAALKKQMQKAEKEAEKKAEAAVEETPAAVQPEAEAAVEETPAAVQPEAEAAVEETAAPVEPEAEAAVEETPAPVEPEAEEAKPKAKRSRKKKEEPAEESAESDEADSGEEETE